MATETRRHYLETRPELSEEDSDAIVESTELSRKRTTQGDGVDRTSRPAPGSQ